MHPTIERGKQNYQEPCQEGGHAISMQIQWMTWMEKKYLTLEGMRKRMNLRKGKHLTPTVKITNRCRIP